MGQWDLWTGFRIRLMTSAGVQVVNGLWAPASDVWMIKLEPSYEPILEARDAGGFSAPSFRGYRAHLSVIMETLAGHVAGSGTTSSLETIINLEQANAGSYYEVALHINFGIPTSTPDYKRCNLLAPGLKTETLGKLSGIRASLEFEGAYLQSTRPAIDNGSTW